MMIPICWRTCYIKSEGGIAKNQFINVFVWCDEDGKVIGGGMIKLARGYTSLIENEST